MLEIIILILSKINHNHQNSLRMLHIKNIFTKKLLCILGLFVILTTACAQQPAPIRSMYDIEPYLDKKLGTPSSFETTYKGEWGAKYYTTLCFRYENRNDLNFTKVAKILSLGFGQAVHVRGKSLPPISGGLVPLYMLQGEYVYKVQFSISSRTPTSLIICILDDQGEIPIPPK